MLWNAAQHLLAHCCFMSISTADASHSAVKKWARYSQRPRSGGTWSCKYVGHRFLMCWLCRLCLLTFLLLVKGPHWKVPSAYFIHEGPAPGRGRKALMTGLKLHFGAAVAPSSSLWVCRRRSSVCNRVFMGKSFCSGLQAACLLSALCFQSSEMVLSNRCGGAV